MRKLLFTLLLLIGSCSAQTTIPSTLFGLIWYYVDPYPTISFGSHRLWDTNATRWQNLNTGVNTYSFTNLDNVLAEIKTKNGPADVLFTISTTPNFISSDPTNSTCNYSSTANGGCGVPTDIAASCTNSNAKNDCDGKTDGTNQTYRSFIYALANHIANLSPATYQTVTSFDTWNEFSNLNSSEVPTSWEGTTAQLVRLYTDANCIITGRGSGCTASAMGVPAVGLLPSAKVLTPSAVMAPAIIYDPWGTYVETAGALLNLDAASVHAYIGAPAPAAGETVATRYNTTNSLLQGAGSSCTAIPCWSTEGSWGTNTDESDLNLQAAFVARYYLVGWSSGFQRLYWYTYVGGANGAGTGTLWVPNGTNGCSNSNGCLTAAGIAYNQTYSWMVGNKMTKPCAIQSGTVWTCTLQQPGGSTMLAVWDTSKTCTPCTYSTFTYPAGYTHYATVAGGALTPLAGGTVQIGAEPILIQTITAPHLSLLGVE